MSINISSNDYKILHDTVSMATTHQEKTNSFKPLVQIKAPHTVLGIDTNNRQEVIRCVRNGIPTAYAIKLQKALDISTDTFGRTVGISAKTISRRRAGKLKKEQSERILRLARIFDKAAEVLKDTQHVRLWFKTPNEALGSETPMDYADTEAGAQEVEDLLGRLEHGVFS